MADHTILGGKVHVYKRGRSRYWQCSTYLAGKNRRLSTKQEGLAQAKDFAEDWYLELRGKLNRGELKSEKLFREAADQFLIEYEVITEGQRNPDYIVAHKTRLRLHLLPFFGDKGLSEITPGLVQEYRTARLSQHSKTEKTFKQAARRFERENGFKAKNRSDREIETRCMLLNAHLVPYFGELLISDIIPETIEQYRWYRLTPNNGAVPPSAENIRREIGALGEMLRWTGRRDIPPSRSTLHQEIVTLRQVTKTAIRHRWLEHLPDFSPPFKKTTKISHRAWFSQEEYKTLYEASRARTRKNKGTGRQWASEQLHDYILFMANTGLRPDEANNLQYRDVEIVEDDATDETILLIEVRGKRGIGYCKSMANAVRPFQRLVERNNPDPTDIVFPADHKKQFNAILHENDLKFDRDGNRRTAYSLRHTYICFRLLEGADIYQVAKNCRTSVEMIEKYYASHISTTLNAAAINVRRPKKFIEKQDRQDQGEDSPSS
jgi:integrase